MFLQRLVADDRADGCGFQYDYMGNALFEWGATHTSRLALANLVMDRKIGGKKLRLFTKWGVSTYGPVDVCVFGDQSTITDLGTTPLSDRVLGDLVVGADAENPRLDDEKYLAWMTVQTSAPLLIIRDTPENVERANKFLQNFIDGILEDEKNRILVN